MKTKGRNYCQT